MSSAEELEHCGEPWEPFATLRTRTNPCCGRFYEAFDAALVRVGMQPWNNTVGWDDVVLYTDAKWNELPVDAKKHVFDARLFGPRAPGRSTEQDLDPRSGAPNWTRKADGTSRCALLCIPGKICFERSEICRLPSFPHVAVYESAFLAFAYYGRACVDENGNSTPCRWVGEDRLHTGIVLRLPPLPGVQQPGRAVGWTVPEIGGWDLWLYLPFALHANSADEDGDDDLE